MKTIHLGLGLIQAGIVLVVSSIFATPAQADIVISEVAPWSSGNSLVGEDWFELTNTGASALDITGWSWDDDSRNAGTALLQGVTSIAAGQSVVFVDGGATMPAQFIANWFGGSAPASFAIGYYDGPGLSTGGDEVNLYDGSNALQAQVIFGSSGGASPYQTFDNAAGLNGTISQMSVAGINGAFAVTHDVTEIGSPGLIAAVPEPETYALMLAGLALVGYTARQRRG